uniref:Uncharacterized protein n=1 Tax=Entomoneis paludosa TaxID=265537 RepID=A0A7S3DQ72_9STRA|mmetsp:Transcript_2797/g.5658  ORF Transcript_2797/g.5658 Transcript_2797/m.5658 type:complete len:135 (+) Transcript_2797:140-544(+)|eukprot:CAMPEP_0172442184 /NCGR_PEP_ID=MMETSP1065-20121228/2660_1 /TAXON_ID=265537 /ORGANISM="Amphiprora paludosa, Strain CCMP125" /LENGTH=134 /DNA_ID=CAMNT_0013191945 /DNA_START=113 /DNA_END=517 /DNA_ORIENTATION=+
MMKTFFAFVALYLNLTLSSAFVINIGHPSARLSVRASTADHLTDLDEMCIENQVSLCGELDCDLEEYEALINRIEDQRDYHAAHVASLEALLFQLRGHDRVEEIDELRTSIDKALHMEKIIKEKGDEQVNGFSA